VEAAREGGSHPRRQVGEAALAGEHGFEFGKFLIAPVIAAALDQLARRGEVHPCLLRELRALLGAGLHGRRRTVVDEPIERRERRDAGESEPRAFERHVAEKEPHRPRLGDLLDLVEIARGATPVADAAAEGGAGEETAGDKFQCAGGAQAVDGLAEPGVGGAGVIARGSGRPLLGVVRKRQPEMGAAKGQRVESDAEKAVLRPTPFQSLARPVAGGSPVTPR
jgi:hypothetical protein